MEINGARYINPLTDFGFKKIFGNEDIMCDFLNDIVEPESPIVKVTFIDKEMPPETKYERGIISESECRTNRDYWLYTLTHLETMNTAVPFQTQKPIFHKLENIADLAKLTREERDYYHVSLDSFRTNLAVMDHERNVGRAEGRAEGREEERTFIIEKLRTRGFSDEEIRDMLN